MTFHLGYTTCWFSNFQEKSSPTMRTIIPQRRWLIVNRPRSVRKHNWFSLIILAQHLSVILNIQTKSHVCFYAYIFQVFKIDQNLHTWSKRSKQEQWQQIKRDVNSRISRHIFFSAIFPRINFPKTPEMSSSLTHSISPKNNPWEIRIDYSVQWKIIVGIKTTLENLQPIWSRCHSATEKRATWHTWIRLRHRVESLDAWTRSERPPLYTLETEIKSVWTVEEAVEWVEKSTRRKSNPTPQRPQLLVTVYINKWLCKKTYVAREKMHRRMELQLYSVCLWKEIKSAKRAPFRCDKTISPDSSHHPLFSWSVFNVESMLEPTAKICSCIMLFFLLSLSFSLSFSLSLSLFLSFWCVVFLSTRSLPLFYCNLLRRAFFTR